VKKKTSSTYEMIRNHWLTVVAFRTFEENLPILLLKLAPQFTARKSWKARERLVDAFKEYYLKRGHENSSELTYARWKAQSDMGATLEDIARLEAITGIGILSNTVPSYSGACSKFSPVPTH
jgi:hypothetical protein